jgi:hypothetical protein
MCRLGSFNEDFLRFACNFFAFCVSSYSKHPSIVPIESCSEEQLAVTEHFPSVEDSKFDVLTDDEKKLITDYYSGEDKKSLAKSNKLSLNGLYIRVHRIKQKIAGNSAKSNKTEM